MHIKHQFDRYPKTDFQGHLIHVCPILNLPIYFVKRGGVGGVRSNEEDRQLLIFFNTILFIHYLPKNKNTICVDGIPNVQNFTFLFSKGN